MEGDELVWESLKPTQYDSVVSGCFPGLGDLNSGKFAVWRSVSHDAGRRGAFSYAVDQYIHRVLMSNFGLLCVEQMSDGIC